MKYVPLAAIAIISINYLGIVATGIAVALLSMSIFWALRRYRYVQEHRRYGRSLGTGWCTT